MHKNLWDIGDFASYNGIRYILTEKSIIFNKDELLFYDTFSEQRTVWKEKKFNQEIKGVRLEGTVKAVEQELVYIHLDIDKVMRPLYPWVWKPEINSHWYLMPEKETKVVLYFPTYNEVDGMAINAFHRKDIFADEQKRELHTLHNKKIELYPSEMSISSNDKSLNLSFYDTSDIQIVSDQKIVLQAQNINLIAPQRITCENTCSNIDMCNSFNFYAPNGVIYKTDQSEKSNHIEKTETKQVDETEDVDHWQLSLAAVGSVAKYDNLYQRTNR